MTTVRTGWTRSRRSELTIIGDVLDTCGLDGIRKTNLMYATSMTSIQIERYLDLLITRGFLDCKRAEPKQARGALFRLTEKGALLLKKIHEVEEMLGDPEE